MSDVRQREIEESHWFRTPESGLFGKFKSADILPSVRKHLCVKVLVGSVKVIFRPQIDCIGYFLDY